MKHRSFWISLAAVGLLGTRLLFADAPAGGPPAGGPGGMQGQWPQKLGLSQEQEQKLQTVMQAHRTAMENLRLQRRQGLEKLRDQVQANAGDSDIQVTLSQLTSVEKAIQAENDHLNRTLSGFLTPKQRAQMLLGLVGRMMRQGRPGASAPQAGGGNDEPDAGTPQ